MVRSIPLLLYSWQNTRFAHRLVNWVGRPRCRSGRVKEEKTFLSLPIIEPRFLGRPAFSLVTNRTKLPLLMLHVVMNIIFRLPHMESNLCRPVHSPPIHCLYLKHILISITLKFHLTINISVTFKINLGHFIVTVFLMLKKCVMYIIFTFLNLCIRWRQVVRGQRHCPIASSLRKAPLPTHHPSRPVQPRESRWKGTLLL